MRGSQKCKGENAGLWLSMRVWVGCVRACVWFVCVCVYREGAVSTSLLCA